MVTIGIPVYNAEKYLLGAVSSVFCQDFSDWELIIVDDGSTDSSLDIAMSINDSRVRVISDGVNRRLPYRLNQIVSEARFNIIARMDADDLCSPRRLTRQLQVMADNPDLHIVTTGVCSIDDSGCPVGVRLAPQGEHQPTLRDMLRGRSKIVHASVIGRRDWFLRNPYDENQLLAEDYELWLRAYMKGDLNYGGVSEPLYFYREDGNVVPEKLLRAYESQREIVSGIVGGRLIRFEAELAAFTYFIKAAIIKNLGFPWVMKAVRERRNDLKLDELEVEGFLDVLRYVSDFKVPRC